MEIQLKVDFDRLTLDDLVAIEEGDQSARFVRSILSRFLVNPETGDCWDQEDSDQAKAAIKQAGKLSVVQARSAVDAFTAQVKELRDAKIPPTKGNS